MRNQSMKAEELLRVDHEAALAKLATAQLQGTWQLAVELARLGVASGAEALAFDLGPSRLELMARGLRLERRLLADFATVLDREVEVAERHRALVSLENRDAFALAALAAVPSTRLRLRVGEEGGVHLERSEQGVQVRGALASEEQVVGFRLEVEGIELNPVKTQRGLENMGRFSPIPISISGDEIARGFEAPLITTRLEATASGADRPNLPVRLAIPRRGHTPRLFLLRHGVVATRATVPGFPAFEAAVEMSSAASPGAESTGAALREIVGPYLEHLVDASIRLNLRLAQDAEGLREDLRARTARRLLEAARKRRRVSEVAGARIFPLVPPDGERRLVSMDEISRLVRVEHGGLCALDAIAPDLDPRDFALSDRGVLVLSDGERALLGEILRVVFSAPPARLRRPLTRRLLDTFSNRAHRLPLMGGVLEEEDLSPRERIFLGRLRSALAAADGAPKEVAFRRRGSTIRRSETALFLPRRHPTIKACMRLLDQQPEAIYPALVFLLAGHGRPGEGSRRRWLGRSEGSQKAS